MDEAIDLHVHKIRCPHMKTEHLSNQMKNPSNDSADSVTQAANTQLLSRSLHVCCMEVHLAIKKSKVTLNVVYVPFINLWEWINKVTLSCGDCYEL